MSSLHLRARVVYMAGPWGAAVSIPRAAIEVVDVDLPGLGDDLIWSGTTDDNGRFDGWSSEWHDSATVPSVTFDKWGRPHWGTTTVEDPTDVLALAIHVTEGGHDVWLPFAYIGDDQQSPDVIVSWGPANQPAPSAPTWPPFGGVFNPQLPLAFIASVNGHGCLIPPDISARVHAEIGARSDSIRIDVLDPVAVGLMAFASNATNVLEWAGGQLGIPEHWRPGRNESMDASASGLAVGCAVVKTGAVPSPVLTAVGVAVLYAVNKGYVKVSMGSGGRGRGIPREGVSFTLTR